MYVVIKLLRLTLYSFLLSPAAMAQYSGGAPLVPSTDPSIVQFNFNNLPSTEQLYSGTIQSVGNDPISYQFYLGKCTPVQNTNLKYSSEIGDESSWYSSGSKNVLVYDYNYIWDNPTTCSNIPNRTGAHNFFVDFSSANGGTPGAAEVNISFAVEKQKTYTTSVTTHREDCSKAADCTVRGLRNEAPATPPPVPYSDDVTAIGMYFTLSNPNYQDVDVSLSSCTASKGSFEFFSPNAFYYKATYGDIKGSFENANVSIKCKSPMYNVQVVGSSYISTLTLKMAGELKASELIPVQVIGNPKAIGSTNDADFILGKSAGFKVILKGTNLSQSTGTVQVAVMNSKNEILVVSGQIKLENINANILLNGQHTVFAGSMSKPNNPGISWIPSAEEVVSAKVKIILGTDTATYGALKFTSTQVKKIGVHKVTPPKIAIVKVQQEGDSSSCPTPLVNCMIQPTSQNFNTLLQTSDYISRIYPVPDNSIRFVSNEQQPTTAVVFNVPTDIDKQQKVGKIAIQEDINQLLIRKTLMSGTQRIIGVVPNSYFLDHFSSAVGIAQQLGKVALVTESQAIAMAHELGHTFGAGEQYIEVKGADGISRGQYSNVGVKGFDALLKNGKRTSYTWPFPDPSDINSVYGMSFMGPSPARKVNADINDLNTYWIDNKSYNNILTNMLKPLPPDPSVLIVSGILSKDGTFEFRSSYTSEEGVVTDSEAGGNLAISTLDSDGKLISTVWVKSDFNLMASQVEGEVYSNPIIETDSMPVVVSLPLDSNIDSIQVVKDNKLLQKSSVKEQVLAGIINRIPDRAFRIWWQCEHHLGQRTSDEERVVKLISKYRRDLEKRVEKIQKAMNSKKPKVASLLLRELILEIELITKRDYEVLDSYELTQKEVIDQITSIIDSLDYEVKGRFKKCWR